MDPDTGQITCKVGDEVYSADEQKIGKVVAFDRRVLTVEHGLIRKDQYFIPMTAVNSCVEGRVYLGATKDETASRGWDMPPPLETDTGSSLGTG
jgi:hypothetical protein